MNAKFKPKLMWTVKTAETPGHMIKLNQQIEKKDELYWKMLENYIVECIVILILYEPIIQGKKKTSLYPY